jgi:hypothetical protein
MIILDRAMSHDEPVTAGHAASGDISDKATADYSKLDDFELIAWRREIRDQLEREPSNMADLVRAHHLLTSEVLRRTFALRRRVPG